jgi:SAM-dependent methyltransferase
MEPRLRLLYETATRPYAAAGRAAWHVARGKLRHDPVYFSLLRDGVLPDRGRLLDVGCGKGILLSLLVAARRQYRADVWPEHWPAPPLNLELGGLDRDGDRVRTARRALGESAQVEVRDLRDFDFPPCSAIVMLDVLMYLGRREQRRALEKAAAALEPGGLLLLREADADAGLAFGLTRLGERFAGALRGEFAQPLHYRRAREWISEFVELGLAVSAASDRSLFANVLFVARRRVD